MSTKRSEASVQERKSDVWLRCVQGWRKKYYLLKERSRRRISKRWRFFSSHLLALAHMFCELSERLTNTLFPVPVGLCGAGVEMGRRITYFGWKTGKPVNDCDTAWSRDYGADMDWRMKEPTVQYGQTGDVARNISW